MCDKLTKDMVIHAWMMRGIEDYFIAFKSDFFFASHKVFHLSMGLELLIKAYLLGKQSANYENLRVDQGRLKVNKLAKSLGHLSEELMNKLRAEMGTDKCEALLLKLYDGWPGYDLYEVLTKAYIETRYPVPKPIHMQFPIGNSGSYWSPINSSGVVTFCEEMARALMECIRDELHFSVPRQHISSLIHGEDGQRFINVLFKGEVKNYIDVVETPG